MFLFIFFLFINNYYKLLMSRPVFPILGSSGRQANFGVVNRVNRVDFVDFPQRTQSLSPIIIPVNTGSSPYQMTVQQVQSNTVILYASGASGSAGTTFFLPSAQQLITSFQGVQVGHSIRLNIVNKGSSWANIFGLPSQGQALLGTGGTGGVAGVIPYLQGITVPPVGTTVTFASLGSGSASNILQGPVILGKRSIDIEFVSISPNPQSTPTDQFVALGATGTYHVY
jgi:hypothetical protein